MSTLTDTNPSMRASTAAAIPLAEIDRMVLAPPLGEGLSRADLMMNSAVDIKEPIAGIHLPTFSKPAAITKLDRYMTLASSRLDARMQTALSHIPDDGRRLLAIKYYARRAKSIDGSWALSSKQLAKYRASKQHRQAIALVEAIKVRFSEQNPGYHLRVDTDVRTLEEQIEIWNSVGSTAAAGEGIHDAASRALMDSTRWPDSPSAADAARFASLISSTGVSQVPTAAVPGFSLHGTGRAFDFIIYQGDKIVAGANAGSARGMWDKPEWTRKLNEAIVAVSDRFVGPLRAPYEPWHYNYRP